MPPHILTDSEQHEQRFQPLAQFVQGRYILPPRVDPDNHGHQLSALLPQITAKCILVIAAEIPHRLLGIDRQVHRRLVD